MAHTFQQPSGAATFSARTAGTAVAAPPKTEFTSTETYLATIDEGVFTFPGNDNLHIRDSVPSSKPALIRPSLTQPLASGI
jgi:hypothetical protein